nr:CHASE2 domain-containing protein [Marinobacter sp. ATCH36]
MVSPFYTRDLARGQGLDSADLVDVILIDDRSIRELSREGVGYLRANDWPLAYSDHLMLIDALRRRGYGTIIFDVTFYRKRSLDGSFNDLVTRLDYFREHAGLEVILSAGSDPEDLEDSIQPLVNAVSDLGLTGWSGYGDGYPLNHVFPDGRQEPSLAFAGYQAFCRQAGPMACEDLSRAEEAWLVPEPSGMHLNWGMPSKHQSDSIGCMPRTLDETWYPAWVELLVVIKRNLVGPDIIDENTRNVCPPLPTATLQDVLFSGSECKPLFDSDGPNACDTPRIAMVGVSLPSARDLFDPPTPGRLPGVYLHAEALRNLLHFQADYFKPLGLELNLGFNGPPQWSLPVDVFLVWPLLLLAAVWLARRVLEWRWKEENTWEIPEILLELGETVLVLIALVLLYQLAIVFHRTPGGLADLIGLIPLLLIVVRRERKEIEHERLR